MTPSGSGHPVPSPPAHSIAVVGGGIIGLSIAWRLAQGGSAVTVYDRSVLGGEASWAGAGMLAPGGEVETWSPLAAAAISSRRMYPEFIAELQRASKCTIDYQECGALELAYTSAELAALEQRAGLQQQMGVPSKAVPSEKVHAFWPHVRTNGLSGARFYPDDAIVNPRDVVRALARVNRDAGVTLLENCGVNTLAVSDEGVRLSSLRGETGYTAAILAAGAWSSEVSIEGVPRIPTAEPVKGHLLGYLQPEQTCTTILRHAGTYLLQRSNGMLLAGASVERVGFERSVQPEIVARLAEEAGAILPHLSETTPTESWTGFRPGSDALQVGRWHSERFYLAYGHYRNGILLAPWTAALVSDAIASNSGTL